MRQNKTAKTIARILSSFSEESPQLGVTDLSKRLGTGKGVIHADLAALVEEGILGQDLKGGKYYLGKEIFRLGHVFFKQTTLRQYSLPIMQEITRITRESTVLAAWINTAAYCIESIDSPHPLKVSLDVGYCSSLHAGSIGKLMLAFLPEDKRGPLIKGFKLIRYTDNTITKISELRERLKEIRVKGYVVSIAERFEDVISVAAPIFNHNNQIVACISVGIPRIRSNQEKISQCIALTVKGAREISEKLGYRE